MCLSLSLNLLAFMSKIASLMRELTDSSNENAARASLHAFRRHELAASKKENASLKRQLALLKKNLPDT